jgi:hypothetical protein
MIFIIYLYFKMVYIYVLKLEDDKYYVGKTNNPMFRFNEHFNNNPCNWTKKYKPLEVIELIPDCDDYDEDKYTKIYMDKYGIDNVRGASYTSVNLDKYTKKLLIKSSHNTNNRCFKCGIIGHFYKDCPDKKTNSNKYETTDEESSYDSSEDETTEEESSYDSSEDETTDED